MLAAKPTYITLGSCCGGRSRSRSVYEVNYEEDQYEKDEEAKVIMVR